MALPPLRVAVVGGGLVGPLLVRLIQKTAPGSSVVVSLLERDGGPWSRDQGTALDLGGGALTAIQEAGLEKEVKEATRSGSDVTLVLDERGKILKRLEPPAFLAWLFGAKEEVNRNELRTCLMESLEEGTVRWGHEAKKIRKVEGGFSLSTLVEGKELLDLHFDVVIGTDGSSSCLRPFVYDDQDHNPFTGYSCVQGFILEPEKSCPHAHSLIGAGSCMGLDGKGTVIWAQRYASDVKDQRVCFYVSLQVEDREDLRKQIKIHGGENSDEAIKTWVSKRLEGWAEEWAELPTAANYFILRNFYQYPALPVMRDSVQDLGVSLCGDALHAMLPFQGAGANVGFQDTRDVSQAIVAAAKVVGDEEKRRKVLVEGLRKAEDVMTRRSSEEAQASWDATVYFHSKGVTKSLGNEFLGGWFVAIFCWMREVELQVGTNWLWPGLLTMLVVVGIAVFFN